MKRHHVLIFIPPQRSGVAGDLPNGAWEKRVPSNLAPGPFSNIVDHHFGTKDNVDKSKEEFKSLSDFFLGTLAVY